MTSIPRIFIAGCCILFYLSGSFARLRYPLEPISSGLVPQSIMDRQELLQLLHSRRAMPKRSDKAEVKKRSDTTFLKMWMEDANPFVPWQEDAESGHGFVESDRQKRGSAEEMDMAEDMIGDNRLPWFNRYPMRAGRSNAGPLRVLRPQKAAFSSWGG